MMQHPFFLKSTKEQRLIQSKIGLLAFALNIIAASISLKLGFYFPIIILITITISIIAPFFDIPSLKKSGKLIYYSNLFVTEKESKGIIKIHGGSLLDYVFVLDKSLNASQRTNYILQKYLEGLLNLIEDCEKNGKNMVKIKGTSYIINERTANKIGLKLSKTDLLQKLLLIFNYPNILVSSSFAKKKISFPKLNQISTFENEVNQLIKRKAYILELKNKLSANLDRN
jgi:hypothetical protein